MSPYAEVIGDPIAQSKSPAIHGRWLAELGIGARFDAVRVAPDELGAYLAARAADPLWRGCSVTIPHKESILPHLAGLDPAARAIGAVNCVVPGPSGPVGYNSDVDGLAAALDGVDLSGAPVAMIGAGGAARAALHYLAERGSGPVTLLVRDPARAAHLRSPDVDVRAFDERIEAAPRALLVINASPLGMVGCPLMPAGLIDALAARASGQTWFDMVYQPRETAFLAAGRAHGAIALGGMSMLIGQAGAAFARFFGQRAPESAPAIDWGS